MNSQQAQRSTDAQTHIPELLPTEIKDCWLRVLIHGLFIGAFGQEGEGSPEFLEIGALYAPPADHKLSLKLFNQCEADEEKPIECFTHRINHRSRIRLQVLGVDADIIKRCDTAVSKPRYHFSNVADFEGYDCYPGKCEKIPAKLGPRLYIYNGVVYTAIRSAPLMMVKDADSPKEWGNITQVLGVGITRGSGAILWIDETPVITMTKGNTEGRYNLVFRNDCVANCKEPPSKNSLSDFNHLFAAFAPASLYEERHRIKIFNNDWTSDQRKDFLENEVADLGEETERAQHLRGLWHIFNPATNFFTRYDPCGMGFFGNSNGLDG